MSHEAASMDEGGTFVGRDMLARLRQYWREKDGKKDSSGARRKRNRRKGKPGRPRLGKDDKRVTTTFKLSPREQRKLKAKAKRAGMTPARWLRNQIDVG